jgi:hypothetical protein
MPESQGKSARRIEASRSKRLPWFGCNIWYVWYGLSTICLLNSAFFYVPGLFMSLLTGIHLSNFPSIKEIYFAHFYPLFASYVLRQLFH